MASPYPEAARERDAWILARRPDRNVLNPSQPHAFLREEERSESAEVVSVATVFLTNRECPWHCLMCDLWRNTLAEPVPPGAIPAQIDYALARLPEARELKLYNSGSFFDPCAIPPEDYAAIAERACRFDRVIVESHPALVGARCLEFQQLLEQGQAPKRRPGPKLEIAMGLETVHPQVLPRLNKRMTLEQFAQAAEFLRDHEIALRAFILVQPPFVPEADSPYWAERSLDFAFDCGATAASLIPTRPGNGSLEALAKDGQFSPPKLSTLEGAAEYGLGLRRGRVFADLWDLEKFSDCAACFPARQARLREMNLSQSIPPLKNCSGCGHRP